MIGFQSRQKVLELIFPVYELRTSFTFQTPPLNDLSAQSFLRPFSLKLWICIVCAIFVVGIAIRQAVYVEITETPNQPFIPSFPLTILSSLGALCQQGMTLILNWNSSRILQVTLFLSSFVLFNYYTSLVVSNLISFPKPTTINSLTALAVSNMELGAENVSYVHYYMKVVWWKT